MSRNLKFLLPAALALVAFGAAAPGVHAAEGFNCSASPCRWRTSRDGTGTTAHHVFIIENATKTESVSFTCESLSGEARSATGTATELTFEWPNTALRPENDRKAYKNCSINGTPGVEIHLKCGLKLRRGKPITLHIGCAAGLKIEVRVPFTGCVFTIGAQELSGVEYHTIGATPNREITVTANVANIAVTADGTKAACGINPEQTLTGTYTTGNTILTAESDNLTEAEEVSEGKSPAMQDGWFE